MVLPRVVQPRLPQGLLVTRNAGEQSGEQQTVKAEFRNMGVYNAEEAARTMNAASSAVHGNVHSAEPQQQQQRQWQRQPVYNPFVKEWPDAPWAQPVPDDAPWTQPVPEDDRQAEVLLTAEQLAGWSSSWFMDDPDPQAKCGSS